MQVKSRTEMFGLACYNYHRSKKKVWNLKKLRQQPATKRSRQAKNLQDGAVDDELQVVVG